MSTKSRGDKGEAFVRKKIAGIKEYHKVINDITFLNEKTEMTHQVDHILIHPHGVFRHRLSDHTAGCLQPVV